MAEWKIVLKDRYPAYLDWETFERVQTMLRDNHAEYQRNLQSGRADAIKRALITAEQQWSKTVCGQ